jgi:hypothetical protein
MVGCELKSCGEEGDKTWGYRKGREFLFKRVSIDFLGTLPDAVNQQYLAMINVKIM